MKKKIFVTGAGGFVGSHLLPFLKNHGYEVCGLVRSRHESKIIKDYAQVVIGDLSVNGQWQNKIKGYDVIIHLAAEISSKTMQAFNKNNVRATKNLVNAARRAGVQKIILFSSAAVTSIRQDFYAQTKKKQEEIFINSKINYLILRPSMIYGPGDAKNIGWLIKMIKRLPIVPLPGGGNFGRQPIFVGDICKIVLKLIESQYKNRIFEIHGYQYVTMSQMTRIIIKKLGGFKPIISVPMFFLIAVFYIGEKILPNPKFTVDQIKSLISGEKFRGDRWWEIFDIIPTKFEDGIDRMI